MMAYHYVHKAPAQPVPLLGDCAVCGLLLTTAATWLQSLVKQVSEMDDGESIQHHKMQLNEQDGTVMNLMGSYRTSPLSQLCSWLNSSYGNSREQ